MKVLLIDNYDSFTYNLVHLLEELGAEVVTVRNDAITLDERVALPRRLVVSPGPGRPDDAGRLDRDHPAARPDDADPRRLPRPPGDRPGLRRRGRPAQALVHGKASAVTHDGRGRLRGPAARGRRRPLPLARRDDLPGGAEVVARTADGEVMGLRHRALPGGGRPVPPGVGPHAARTAWPRNFLEAR